VKNKYTDKRERRAEHIEESYESRGVPEKEAERRAWTTVNKHDAGGKQPGGSGRVSAPDVLPPTGAENVPASQLQSDRPQSAHDPQNKRRPPERGPRRLRRTIRSFPI
jgi:hypothetical protein